MLISHYATPRSPVQRSLANSPLKPQDSSSNSQQQPTPMRLSHFFVVVVAAFLATSALADSKVTSGNEPSHRNLMNAPVNEERETLREKLDRILGPYRKAKAAGGFHKLA
ncbi:hypothetical protein P3T76_006317 [Phytophthora citrophthora]|uniref:Uncharacterized protein n=1 Tax=Phytophthora citrophthora TaxID=4793 RepID=A0AAD9GNR4_9STRA|nr:hypothetical protein P3T76_006317 [Phytophthora citrophthora]